MKIAPMLVSLCSLAVLSVAPGALAAEAKSIVIADAGYAGACNVEGVRAQVERYLNVPVTLRSIKAPAGNPDVKEWYEALQKSRTSNDVFIIGLVSATNLAVQQGFAPQIGTGIVNVPAVHTNETAVWEKRILRLVMRDIAFLAGLPPSQDPFCVTRPYKDVAGLDKLGLNYFPPWQMKFAETAASLGLKPVRDIKAEIQKRRAARQETPPAPPTVPAPAAEKSK